MALQEPSLVSGSYRGPVDEAQFEMLASGNGTIGIFGHVLSTTDSAWDRFEFWYENERHSIVRGGAGNSETTLNEFGAYGSSRLSINRDEFLVKTIPLLIEATLSADAAARESALLSLGRVAYPATTPFIIEALSDSEESVRQAAYVALGLMSTYESNRVLLDTFNHSQNYNAKCFAAVGLGLSERIDSADCLNNFFRTMPDNNAWHANDNLIISALLAAKMNKSIDYSENLLLMADVVNRREASNELQVALIEALAAAPNVNTLQRLVENINSKDKIVAEASISALGRIEADVATVNLIRLFEKTNSPRLQGLIQMSLGQIGSTKAVDFLVNNRPRLADAFYVRTSWLIACGLAKSSATYDQVAGTLLHGSDYNKHDDADASRKDEYELRGAAALSLGLYARPAARIQLEKCLQEDSISNELSGYIATALGMLGTDEATEVLLHNAEHFNQSPESRRGFATALGMCANERANAYLTEMLITNNDATVRWTLAHAMAGARDQQSFDKLVSAIRADIHAVVTNERTAHLLLGLGYLGDAHSGATLESFVANVDFRRQNKMLNCLKSY